MFAVTKLKVTTSFQEKSRRRETIGNPIHHRHQQMTFAASLLIPDDKMLAS